MVGKKNVKKQNKTVEELEKEDFLGSLTVHKFEIKKEDFAPDYSVYAQSHSDGIDPTGGDPFDYGADQSKRDKTFNR